jgi:hypothetical protein
MDKYNVQMSVIFCKKHKKYFEDKVKVHLSKGGLGINPTKLTRLLHNAERCTQCRWKTLFNEK